MVHRSIVGSLERLFAHLIEVHDGAFPAWYAPVQLVVAAGRRGPGRRRARSFAASALAPGLRVEVAADGSLGARIRDAARARVPYVAVIGAREAAVGRCRCACATAGNCRLEPVGDALALIQAVVAAHSLDLVPSRSP